MIEESLGGAKIIFVGGIHGVGKSTLCAQVCSRFGIEHLVAGDLIRAQRNATPTKAKAVNGVGENQDLLVQALRGVLVGGRTYLLDGHFALLAGDGLIADIPVDTYQAIAPVGVALVLGDPERIADRLSSRDGKAYDVALLRSLQGRERTNGLRVCDSHRIKPKLIDMDFGPDPVQELQEFVSGWV